MVGIYDRIKKLSEERGLSIAALEKLSGLGNGTIGGWRQSSPTLESLERISVVLGIPVSQILEKENEDKEEG